MRYIYSLLLMFSVTISSSYACDVCGVNAASMGIGFITNYNNNYIRFGYSQIPFQGVKIIGTPSHHLFHQYDLEMRYGIGSRLRFTASLPYQVNRRTKGEFSETQAGIGDVRLISQYALLNNVSVGNASTIYVEAGIGLTIPTGAYEREIDDRGIPENFNTGRGVAGIIGQLNATWKIKSMGIAYSGSYQTYPSDAEGYHFGDQLNSSLSTFYTIQKDDFSVIPFAGVNYEFIKRDAYDYGVEIRGTGGKGTFITGGLNIAYSDFQIGGMYMLPIHENYSDKEVKAEGRWSLQVTYIF